MKIIKQQQPIEDDENYENSEEENKSKKNTEQNNKKQIIEEDEELEDGSYNEDESEQNDENEEEESSIHDKKKKSKKPQLKKKRTRENPKREKKNRRNLNELFDIEAEDDDDEEESYGDAEGEISVQEQNKILKELNNNKIRGLHAKEQMKKFYDRSAEEIAESYENMERDEEEILHGSKDDVSQQLKQPSIKDPKLWLVKCKIGKEKEAVQSLYHKYFSMIDSDNPLK